MRSLIYIVVKMHKLNNVCISSKFRFITDAVLSAQFGIEGYTCSTNDCNSFAPMNCTSAAPIINMSCYESHWTYENGYGEYSIESVAISVGNVCIASCLMGEPNYGSMNILSAMSMISNTADNGLGAYLCSTPNCNSAPLDCTMLTCYVGWGDYVYSYSVPYGYVCVAYCYYGVPQYTYMESSSAVYLSYYYGDSAYSCSTADCNLAPSTNCTGLSCYVGYDDVVSSQDYIYSYYECVGYCYNDVAYYSYSYVHEARYDL